MVHITFFVIVLVPFFNEYRRIVRFFPIPTLVTSEAAMYLDDSIPPPTLVHDFFLTSYTMTVVTLVKAFHVNAFCSE